MAQFTEADATRMIDEWRRLAIVHRQHGRTDSAVRLERLATQMEDIANTGIDPQPVSSRDVTNPNSHPKRHRQRPKYPRAVNGMR